MLTPHPHNHPPTHTARPPDADDSVETVKSSLNNSIRIAQQHIRMSDCKHTHDDTVSHSHMSFPVKQLIYSQQLLEVRGQTGSRESEADKQKHTGELKIILCAAVTALFEHDQLTLQLLSSLQSFTVTPRNQLPVVVSLSLLSLQEAAGSELPALKSHCPLPAQQHHRPHLRPFWSAKKPG